jgi:hypothetical protein
MLNYMNILSANQDTTTRFAVTIEEINAKYKKEKKDLKRIIAETARSQAEQILANEDDDSMGDPKEMLNELMPLRLQYNSIVIKQKQEMDIAMDRYNVEIWNNMGNEKITCIKKNYDDAIRLEVYDKYIQTAIKDWDVPKNGNIWPTNYGYKHLFTLHLLDSPRCNTVPYMTGESWFNNFTYTIKQKINEKRTSDGSPTFKQTDDSWAAAGVCPDSALRKRRIAIAKKT